MKTNSNSIQSLFIVSLAALSNAAKESTKKYKCENCMPVLTSALSSIGIPPTAYSLQCAIDETYGIFTGAIQINFGKNMKDYYTYNNNKEHINANLTDGDCKGFFAKITDDSGNVKSGGGIFQPSKFLMVPVVALVVANAL